MLLMVSVAIAAITGCKTQRSIVKEPIKEYGADFIFNKLKENELKFDWFSGKFSLDLIIDKKKTSFSGQIRVRKDSAIWVSFSPVLGIEMARMLITEDSVLYLNRISNTYFAGSTEYVNNFLQTNIDFDVIQSLLLGNDLTYYENGKFRTSYDSKEYHLVTAGRRKLKKYVKNKEDENRIYIQNIFLDPATFKITQLRIKELEKENKKLEAVYSNFIAIEGQLFPHHILYDIVADVPILVNIDYSRINIGEKQKMPFKIPEKYTRIY